MVRVYFNKSTNAETIRKLYDKYDIVMNGGDRPRVAYHTANIYNLRTEDFPGEAHGRGKFGLWWDDDYYEGGIDFEDFCKNLEKQGIIILN